jgi:hypothetical protein
MPQVVRNLGLASIPKGRQQLAGGEDGHRGEAVVGDATTGHDDWKSP